MTSRTNPEFRVELVDLVDRFGDMLWDRETGLSTARTIVDADPATILLLDLNGVKAISVDFLATTFTGVAQAVRQRKEFSPLVAFLNNNDSADRDIAGTLEVLAGAAPTPAMVVAENKDLRLASSKPSPSLEETFRVTKLLSSAGASFTAPQIARTLGMELPATNQRLTKLHKSGAITRWADPSTEHGARYLYRSLVEADLHS